MYIRYMMVDQNSFIREWPFFANKTYSFANLARTPCLSPAEPMLSNSSSYENSFTTCQITQNYHGYLLHSLVKTCSWLASRNPLLRAGCCWLGNFLQGLLGHSLQNALWLSPTFSQNFRENTPIKPQPSARGASEEKANTRGLGVCLAPARSHFWKLGRCMWSLFLETSESNVRQYQRQTMVRMLDLSHLFWHEVTPLQGTARKIKSPHDIQKSSHHRQITMAQHAQKFNQILWYRSRISSRELQYVTHIQIYFLKNQHLLINRPVAQQVRQSNLQNPLKFLGQLSVLMQNGLHTLA